jgi:hypothetical protein
VNTSQTGTYSLSYLRVDTAGNVSNIVNRTVNVLLMSDTVSPIVTIIGQQNINIIQGSNYIDSGATWIDNVDGSGALVASGSVNTAIPGNYTLSYSRVDSSGNVSIVRYRTITVIPSFTSLSGSTFTGSSVYLNGSTSSGIVFGSSTGSITLVNSGSSVSIPTLNLTIFASGNPWNGIMFSPSQVSANANIQV